MGWLGSGKQWTSQARSDDRARRAHQETARRRAADARRANRAHARQHPARIALRFIFK